MTQTAAMTVSPQKEVGGKVCEEPGEEEPVAIVQMNPVREGLHPAEHTGAPGPDTSSSDACWTVVPLGARL